MNEGTNSVEAFARPEPITSETYSFVASSWTCAKCRHQIDKWHHANELTGLIIHRGCGGRYLPSDFYYLAMGDCDEGPTAAAASDHGLHGMHDDWLA
jgi:hypothetical protein